MSNDEKSNNNKLKPTTQKPPPPPQREPRPYTPATEKKSQDHKNTEKR